MNLVREDINSQVDLVEKNLEDLVIHTINILKDFKLKGLIDEDEYLKHIKIKEEFLVFLQEKRKK